MAAELSLIELIDRIESDHDAYLFLEEMRWGNDGPTQCPHPECDNNTDGFYFLKPKDGTKTRRTRTGAATQRRLWKCAKCPRKFSVLTGTPMHASKISARKWVLVIFEVMSAKNGVSAREIERKYKLSPKSAWFMLHRIREGMTNAEIPFWTDATVVADETYVGGKVNKMNKKRKQKFHNDNPSPFAGEGSAGTSGKTPALTLVNRETGEAYTRVTNDVTRSTLTSVLLDVVDVPNVDLHTDRHPGYTSTGRKARSHERADHGRGEYATPNGGGINPVESYFSHLKRSIDGTHHHVSRVHLQRYVNHFDFLYNTRNMTDTARMGQLDGKRLTYKPSRLQ